jgi:hypothetical protein
VNDHTATAIEPVEMNGLLFAEHRGKFTNVLGEPGHRQRLRRIGSYGEAVLLACRLRWRALSPTGFPFRHVRTLFRLCRFPISDGIVTKVEPEELLVKIPDEV